MRLLRLVGSMRRQCSMGCEQVIKTSVDSIKTQPHTDKRSGMHQVEKHALLRILHAITVDSWATGEDAVRKTDSPDDKAAPGIVGEIARENIKAHLAQTGENILIEEIVEAPP
jgi:hypothetical protein